MTVTFFPALILVAVFGVRVIGAKVGRLRAVLISWLGLATGGFLLLGIGRAEASRTVGIAVVVIGLIAMVAWAAVFDLLAPPLRPANRRVELNPLTALRQSIARARRRVGLAVLATRFGLSRYTRGHASRPAGTATGAALRSTLQRAGGVYVKLGQFLSTRPDLVSTEVAAELRSLQQHVEPIPFATVRALLARELADSGVPEDLFVALHERPAAAASIAQVHRATLPDGRTVAVKVQRPAIAERIQRDLDILVRSAERLEARTGWAADLGVAQTAAAFSRSVEAELDFEAEARNLRTLAAAVAAHPRVVVPEPIARLSRQRVLVMEWIDGEPITHAARRLSAAERYELADVLLSCTLDQLLTVGTFHADPHPGNMLLTTDGRIALIDCGSMGILDRRQRDALRRILAAIATQDAGRLATAIRRITTARHRVDQNQLERALGVLLVEHLQPGTPPGAELMAALMALMRVFTLVVDPVIAGALRALATVQATLEVLEPSFDLVRHATGHVSRTSNPLNPGGRPLRAELEDLLPHVLPTMASLPRRVDRIIETLERDELALGIHLLPTDEDRRAANRIVAQLAVAIVPTALGIIGALLVLAANGQPGTSTGRVIQSVGLGCIGIALLVLFSTLLNSLREVRQQ